MRHAAANSGAIASCSGGGGPDDGGDGGGGGSLVVVGVKMEQQRSRELLTWALVTVARSGDRVIAIHVVDPNADKASLLAVMKNFSSLLPAYEGFCNMKQVDLKFKIRKGSPARKILVGEAKSCGAVALILGASSEHHRIRSRTSVAEYCAKNLPKSISVLCVDNGKVVFRRSLNGGSVSRTAANKHAPKISVLLPKSSISLHSQRSLCSVSSERENVAMDLVPFSKQKVLQSKPRWTLLHSVLLVAQRAFGVSSSKGSPMGRLVAKLPFQSHAAAAMDPIRKQITASDRDACPLDYGFCYLKPETEIKLPVFSSKFFLEELNAIRDKFSTTCQWFTYQELILATNNFLPNNLIGKGGSSLVYRGCLQGGKAVAVKILRPSKDVLKQFVSEVEIITSLHHRNIVSLVGLCFGEEKLLLVYNLLSKGSMEENLHGTEKDTSLFGWQERYKVAVGVAEALDHLHSHADPIIHRDVKSSNILLSDNFEAQLSDFGLATRASSSSAPHVEAMEVAGTFGYLAPEYFFHGKVSERIDVYAFGVVLLELLSGRKPVDCELPKGQESLVMWAKRILHKGKVSELKDPKLADSCNSDQFELMALAAALCIRSSPQSRPGISTVLKLLKSDPEAVQWAKRETQTCEETDDTIDHQSAANIQSFLDLAMLNLEEEEDDSVSSYSAEQTISVEGYLGGRQSCSST